MKTKKEVFRNFYFNTYFKVLEYLRENKFALKTELMYLGEKKQQIKQETLTNILEVLETQNLIKINLICLGQKKIIQIKYIGGQRK